MVENKKTKREKDIKSKLLAAIAMLLVSSIMMVSTTYAWFTLSTAPEVTGITTAVGANGNLEIALLPTNGDLNSITTAVGDSMKVQIPFLANVTWGNLVDLSDNTNYGTDKFVLNPSKLGVDVADENGNPTKLNTSYFLQFPQYGSDGRITNLSQNTVTSVYNQTNGFVPNELYGVRALGVSSGMTPRQLAYRNARGAASTATSQAKNEAFKSLEANGNTLANIAVKKATGDAAYTAEDVKSMRAIVDDLQTKVLPQIETAYLQYILAYAASAATTNELAWKAVESEVTAAGAKLLDVLDYNDGTYSLSVTGEDGTDITVALPAGLNTAIAEYAATLAQVNSADDEVGKLETTLATTPDATFTWAEISTALKLLADTEGMVINGYTPGELMSNINDFAKDVMKNGVTVVMNTGGGVYADVADHCGDYSANIVIEKIEYNGVELEDLEAKMETKSSVSPSYLTAVGTAVTGAGAPASTGTVMPLSDMYGYIIDLAFRTNAANSNLLLQANALDRIYSDNSNDETMGHGATMTFASTTPDFTNENVTKLMACIRIVFFDPDTGNVYATAKLDVANAEVTADGIVAKMYVYEVQAGEVTYTQAADTTDTDVTYYTKTTNDVYTAVDDATAAAAGAGTLYTKDADGNYNAATYAADSGLTYYTKSTEDVYTEATPVDGDGKTYYIVASVGASTETKVEDNVITSLPRNEAIKLSVLVYLDGETITNADVANAATSMTGSLNLQFSSSATLVPMEYGDLHITGATTETTTESTP